MSRNILTRGNVSLVEFEKLNAWITLPKTMRLTGSAKHHLELIANASRRRLAFAAQTVLIRSSHIVAEELGLVACSNVGSRGENILNIGPVSDDTRRILEEEARRNGSNIEHEALNFLLRGIRMTLVERELTEREGEEAKEA